MPIYPSEQEIIIDDNISVLYTVNVKDNENKPLRGAIVLFKRGSVVLQRVISNSRGEAFFSCTSTDTSGIITADVSLSGYNSQSSVEVVSNGSVDVILTKIQNPEPELELNSYIIYIKDSSSNAYIADARIELYDSDDNLKRNGTTDTNGRFHLDDTDVYYKVKVIKNGYESITRQISPNEIYTISLNKVKLTNYYYVLKVEDENNNPIPGVSVGFYTNFSFTTHWCKCSNCGNIITSDVSICPNCQSSIEMYKTTDENGLVSISLGELSNNPGNKYVRVENLPDGYISDGSVIKGSISPTLSENEVGCTLVLKHETLFKYCFRIIDKFSEQPINDVKVIAEGNDIGLKQSYFELEYNSDTLDVIIQKDGYETSINNFSFVSNKTYQVKLTPENYVIKIVEKKEDGSIVPVGNKSIKLVYKNGNSEQVIGTYITNGDGCIYLNRNYYSPTEGYYYILCEDKQTILSDTYYFIQIDVTKNDDEDEPDTKNIIKGVFGAFNEMSVGSIKDRIDSGNKENDSNSVSYHGKKDYKIKILNPDSINVYDIFEATPVRMYNDEKNVISSMDVGLKSDLNELRLKMINRYSGYYNPIFKDILFYNNMTTKEGVKCPFSNTSFDYDYEDNFGKFGIINNMWFHKTNDNKDIKIISTNTPYYPLNGQYALDHKDYNVFETNWDTGHYIKQTDIDNSEACENISSMKEGLCLFGSKYLNVPETIEIYGLTLGTGDGEWNDEWITQPEACPGEIMFKEINDNSVDFYIFLKKRIIRFFQDKLREEFKKYIDDKSNSFNKEGIDDDIEEYVKKNILKLYKLEKVRMFVRRTKRGIHNSMIENDYTKYLEYDKTHPSSENKYFENHNLIEYFKQHGFVEVNTIRLNKINTDDFDRKIVYNLQNGIKEEFGFSFIIKKI